MNEKGENFPIFCATRRQHAAGASTETVMKPTFSHLISASSILILSSVFEVASSLQGFRSKNSNLITINQHFEAENKVQCNDCNRWQRNRRRNTETLWQLRQTWWWPKESWVQCCGYSPRFNFSSGSWCNTVGAQGTWWCVTLSCTAADTWWWWLSPSTALPADMMPAAAEETETALTAGTMASCPAAWWWWWFACWWWLCATDDSLLPLVAEDEVATPDTRSWRHSPVSDNGSILSIIWTVRTLPVHTSDVYS